MSDSETTTDQPKENLLRTLFTGLVKDLKQHNLLDKQKLLDFLKEAHPELHDPQEPPPVDNAHVAEGAELFPETETTQPETQQEETTEEPTS